MKGISDFVVDLTTGLPQWTLMPDWALLTKYLGRFPQTQASCSPQYPGPLLLTQGPCWPQGCTDTKKRSRAQNLGLLLWTHTLALVPSRPLQSLSPVDTRTRSGSLDPRSRAALVYPSVRVACMYPGFKPTPVDPGFRLIPETKDIGLVDPGSRVIFEAPRERSTLMGPKC